MNKDNLADLLEFAYDISRDNEVYNIPTHVRLHRLLARPERKEREQHEPTYDEILKNATSLCEQIVAVVDVNPAEKQMILKTQSWMFHAALGYATSTSSDKGWAYDNNCSTPWSIHEYFTQGYKQYKDDGQSRTAYVTDVIKYVAMTKTPWLAFDRDHRQSFSSHEHGGSMRLTDIIDVVTNVMFPVKEGVGLFTQILEHLNGGAGKESVKKLLEKNFDVKSNNNHTADFGFTPVQRAQSSLKIGFIGLDSNEAHSSWDFILGTFSSESKVIYGGGVAAYFDPEEWEKRKESVTQKLDQFGDKAVGDAELA